MGLALMLGGANRIAAQQAPADQLYETSVRPLLAKHCSRCHGAEKQQASLRLDYAAGIKTGGDSGPALVPGKSADSLIVKALLGQDDVSKMPPEGDGPTPDAIAKIAAWIDAGAIAPADEPVPEPKARHSDHWSFQPVEPVTPPVVAGARNAIDAFVAARLQAAELSMSPEASRETLLRRVTLDLIGLLPAPDEIAEYRGDPAPDAYERMVDRLLASPHYGERWGRYWLDAARYADSNGFTRDMPRTIWPYRDWVVDAINRNLPFDEFTVEQIAGDLLPNPTLDQLVATGFHRNTLINEEGGTDPEQFRVEAVVDRVNTTGAVFLGLTIGCAQCHDHKYDPITQRDYYRLYAFYNQTLFEPSDPYAPKIDVPTPWQRQQGLPERKQQIRAEIKKLEQELKDRDAEIVAETEAWVKTLTPEDKNKLPFNVKNAVELPPNDRSDQHKRDLDAYYRGLDIAKQKYPQLQKIAELKASEPQFATTMVTSAAKEPRETHIQLRGDFLRNGAQVTANVPAVLPGLPEAEQTGRLELAKWLVSPTNPLTPRVTVNRAWQKLFGRGIVETENDFGAQGEPPTHPLLLDWLATRFVDTGWDNKALHRLMVASATYRQSSALRPELAEHDSPNKLLGRQSRLRLDAELIRDVGLSASGLLCEELGGPSVTPPQPEGVFDFTQDKKPWTPATGKDRYRRALYTQLLRSSLYPSLMVFDYPDPNSTCTRRNRSNTPLQALTLANDLAFMEFTRGLASRLLSQPTADDSARLTAAFELCLTRSPNSQERNRLLSYLQSQRAEFGAATELSALAPLPPVAGVAASEGAAWTMICRVLMNLDEFITRE
jgi:hypothetical protein